MGTRVKTWFDSLNRVYQTVIILVFFLGLLGSGVTGILILLDHRIRLHVDPVADMVEFGLKTSGQWDAYLQDKSNRERDRKAREGAQVRAGSLPITTN